MLLMFDVTRKCAVLTSHISSYKYGVLLLPESIDHFIPLHLVHVTMHQSHFQHKHSLSDHTNFPLC